MTDREDGMRELGFVRNLAVTGLAAAALLAVPQRASAILLTIEQSFSLPNEVDADAEGVASISSGPNRGMYIPHDSSGLVSVLDYDTGAFLYDFSINFATFPNTEFRSIDFLPNGNLVIGQHDVNYVREVIIPANPGDGSIPAATYGTIGFGLPSHPSPVQPFDEFESLASFSRPSDGAVFLLIGEEGRTKIGDLVESPGEIYLAQVTGAGITGFTKLFEVPFADNFDDVSGLDVVNVAFDTSGNLDLARSRIVITDDSSGNGSTAYVLDLNGQVLETLDGPGGGVTKSFESIFGEAWRDAEGADYDPVTGKLTVLFSTGASGTRALVRFVSTLEAPVQTPEPAAPGLLALSLGLLALRMRSRVAR